MSDRAKKLAEYIRDGRLTLIPKNYDRIFASDDYFEAPEELSDEDRALIADALSPPAPPRDALGRLVDPAAMPEHIKDMVATCYGLLWGAETTDKRIHRARAGLLQWLTKDEQARGIDMARGIMLMCENRELVDSPRDHSA